MLTYQMIYPLTFSIFYSRLDEFHPIYHPSTKFSIFPPSKFKSVVLILNNFLKGLFYQTHFSVGERTKFGF